MLAMKKLKARVIKINLTRADNPARVLNAAMIKTKAAKNKAVREVSVPVPRVTRVARDKDVRVRVARTKVAKAVIKVLLLPVQVKKLRMIPAVVTPVREKRKIL